MPGNAAQLFLHLKDYTLQLAVDPGVLLVEGKVHFILKVAVSGFRCDASDVIGGDHLGIDQNTYSKLASLTLCTYLF